MSETVLAAFAGMTAEVQPVETVLHGEVPDRAALHGLLDRVESLGLELVEVRRLPTGAEDTTSEHAQAG